VFILVILPSFTRFTRYAHLYAHIFETRSHTLKRLFLFLPLLLALTACGESQATSSNPTPSTAKPTVSPPHFYNIGETVTLQPWEITLKSAKIVDPATYSQHDQIFPNLKPDDRFLVLDEHLKNVSALEQNIAGMQFVLQDKDGSSNYSVQIGLPDISGSGLGGDVSPTMQMSGQEAYIVPSSAHLLYWVYNPIGKANQVIWQINI
jgi:hypothetical protein